MVRYETAGARATITIDEPERRNPLSTTTMAELLEHTRAAQADPSVRVIVYTGAGERAFSAGGDLSSGFVDDPSVFTVIGEFSPTSSGPCGEEASRPSPG